jgi:hypothetical protein
MNALSEALRWKPSDLALYEFGLLMIRLGVYHEVWLPFISE